VSQTKTRQELLLVTLLFALRLPSSGQQPLDALVFGAGTEASGNLKGVGWTFTPFTDLRVTSVGFDSPNPFRLTQSLGFWQGTNQLITSYLIDNTNGLNYQPIPPFLLTAGTTYGISCQPTNLESGTVDFFVYSREGSEGIATFDTSPYLKQFENFQVSTNGRWTPNPARPNNRDWLFLGPTFRFELVHPPANLPFSITSIIKEPNGTISIQWESGTNQLYQVMRSFNLARNDRTVLGSNLLATPPLNTFTDTIATNNAAYYWIEVQQ